MEDEIKVKLRDGGIANFWTEVSLFGNDIWPKFFPWRYDTDLNAFLWWEIVFF